MWARSLRPVRVGVPVISVGNLVAGGTGKTPLVVYLARLLSSDGANVAIVSRGYGRRSRGALVVSRGDGPAVPWQEAGDEPYLMALLTKGARVLVAARRADGVRAALAEGGTDVVLLDDGFQHVGLARDLDIVAVDASAPLGNGHLLPAGTLREHPLGIARAGVIVATRCDQARGGARLVGRTVGLLAPKAPIIETRMVVAELWDVGTGAAVDAAEVRGVPALALSSIADPAGLAKTARDAGLSIAAEATYPDHHAYWPDDLEAVAARVRESGAASHRHHGEGRGAAGRLGPARPPRRDRDRARGDPRQGAPRGGPRPGARLRRQAWLTQGSRGSRRCRGSVFESEVRRLKADKGALILAHNYQVGEVQAVADHLGDSLKLARLAARTDARLIVLCGVRFMAESAKVLNPDRKVVLPSLTAGCPMADMITVEELRAFKAAHPGAPVVCYVNTSADVKAESDVCCTSSNAVAVVNALDADRVLFVPDRNLASYVASKTTKTVIPWNGYCYVHNLFTPEDVALARAEHPGVPVVVHPECTPEVVAAADFVASTDGMVRLAALHDELVVGTEIGLVDMLQRENPAKRFHELSPYAVCRNMKETTLARLAWSLTEERHEITVPRGRARGRGAGAQAHARALRRGGSGRTRPGGPGGRA